MGIGWGSYGLGLPSGSGARICNSQLLRGNQQDVHTLRWALECGRHQGQWRRTARFETVKHHGLDMSNACKPRCSSLAGRPMVPRFTTSAPPRADHAVPTGAEVQQHAATFIAETEAATGADLPQNVQGRVRSLPRVRQLGRSLGSARDPLSVDGTSEVRHL